MNPKKKAVIVWTCVFIVSIILTIISFKICFKNNTFIWLFITAVLSMWDITALIIWLTSFTFKYRRFYVDDDEVEVYVGFKNHYIKVNGDIKDEIITSVTFSPMYLNCKINSHEIDVTISPSNALTIKCDGEIIRNFITE